MEAATPSVTESTGISLLGLTIIPLIVYILISVGVTALVIILIVRAIQASGNAKVPSGDSTQSEPIRTSLAQVLRDYRIRSGMTQELVAEKLGISRQAVSKWESGKAEPSTSNLIAIAALYQVPPEEILRQVMP